MDCYSSTKNATKMKQEIERNRRLWNRQSTPEAVRLRQVHGLLDAIETGDYIEILKVYYRDQHQHTLNMKDQPLEIPVYIHHDQLDIDLVSNVNDAITSINDVTPGIILYETRIKSDSRIRIGVDFAGDPMIVGTKNGSILDSQHERTHKKPFIHFGKKRNVTKGTCIHELMHALSFHHEMQRFDNDMYLRMGEHNDHNYHTSGDKVLTRFDPFSVMMYPEHVDSMIRRDGDPIWNLKPQGNRCQELSELNKVALNIKFKPCINKSKNYSPKLSIQTEMLYCGRKVMTTHNQVGKPTTDGFCGPNNWANCAACRVVTRIRDNTKQSTEIPKLKKCLGKGKWQGLSGLFYCGKLDVQLLTDLKHVNSNGICGPDTGVPCIDCGQELFKGYSVAGCDNIFKAT